MTACADIRQKLSPYMDGLLEGQEKGRIEEHLSSCAECTAALADLKKTTDLLRNLEEVDPPPWLTAGIMTHVREEAEAKQGILQRLFYPLHIKIPVEAFVGLLVVVLGIYVYKATGPELKSVAPPQAVPEKSMPMQEPSKEAPSRMPADRAPKVERPLLQNRESEKDFTPASPTVEPGHVIEKKEGGGGESSSMDEAPSSPPAPRKEEVPAAAEMGDRRAEKRFRGRLQSGLAKDHNAAVLMTVAVKVNDIAAATKEVENLLGRFGATHVDRKIGSAGTGITILLPAENFKPFYEKLRDIGEIIQEGRPPGTEEEAISLRVEILPRK